MRRNIRYQHDVAVYCCQSQAGTAILDLQNDVVIVVIPIDQTGSAIMSARPPKDGELITINCQLVGQLFPGTGNQCRYSRVRAGATGLPISYIGTKSLFTHSDEKRERGVEYRNRSGQTKSSEVRMIRSVCQYYTFADSWSLQQCPCSTTKMPTVLKLSIRKPSSHACEASVSRRGTRRKRAVEEVRAP